MNTCEWTERVALSVDQNSTDVDRHVSACSECRELLADLHAGRDLLQETLWIPEKAYEDVRARVLESVRPSRWPWAVAAAVALVALGASIWGSYELYVPVEPLEIAIERSHAPVIVQAAAASSLPDRCSAARQHVTVPRAGARNHLALALRDMLGPGNAPPVAAAGAVVMSIQTEDPDVLIVLVPESKGDGE